MEKDESSLTLKKKSDQKKSEICRTKKKGEAGSNIQKGKKNPTK